MEYKELIEMRNTLIDVLCNNYKKISHSGVEQKIKLLDINNLVLKSLAITDELIKTEVEKWGH